MSNFVLQSTEATNSRENSRIQSSSKRPLFPSQEPQEQEQGEEQGEEQEVEEEENREGRAVLQETQSLVAGPFYFQKIIWTTSYCDSLLLTDLDAYNYTGAFLNSNAASMLGVFLEKRDFIPPNPTQDILVASYRRELLSNSLFFQYVERSFMHAWPTKARLFLATACLALDEIKLQADAVANLDRTNTTHVPYWHMSHMRSSLAYQRLCNFILSGSLLVEDYQNSIEVFVHFKAFKYFHSVNAMKKDGNAYQSYGKRSAIELLEKTVVLGSTERSAIPAQFLDAVTGALEAKVIQLTADITGRGLVEPEREVLEKFLTKMMERSLVAANEMQPPILFSVNDDVDIPASTSKMRTELLSQARNQRGKPNLLDTLGLAGNVVPPMGPAGPSTTITQLGHESKRVFWTDAENIALEEGMLRHSTQWALIRLDKRLMHRTAVQLKDRARNIYKKLRKENQPLGPFDKMGSCR